jgi:hypothetical protein
MLTNRALECQMATKKCSLSRDYLTKAQASARSSAW